MSAEFERRGHGIVWHNKGWESNRIPQIRSAHTRQMSLLVLIFWLCLNKHNKETGTRSSKTEWKLERKKTWTLTNNELGLQSVGNTEMGKSCMRDKYKPNLKCWAMMYSKVYFHQGNVGIIFFFKLILSLPISSQCILVPLKVCQSKGLGKSRFAILESLYDKYFQKS